MQHSIPFLAVLPATLVIGLSGCGGAQHSQAERYFLVCSNSKVPYWQEAGAGLFAAARQLNVRADLIGPDSYDPQAQQQEFKRIMGLKPAGILVSPADPNLLKADIDNAIAAGVPVITIDSDAPGSNRLLFVGTNNYQAGLMGGRTLGKLLNGKGNVVIYSLPAQVNIQERLSGYRAALEAFPQIKIVDVVDTHGDARVAFDKTTEILDKSAASVDAFACLEAQSCQEVAEVLARKNVTGKKVVAMDTQQGTLEWIDKGVIAATVGQKPYTMAYTGLKILADLQMNKLPSLTADFAASNFAPIPTFIDTGATLIDKAGVARFREASTQARATKN